MNSNTFKGLVKLLVVFGGIAILSYLSFRFLVKDGYPGWFPQSTDELMSLDQEDELGKLIAEELIDQDGDYLLKDAFVDSVVFIIQQRLVSSLELTDYDYTIKVLDDPRVNAFTIPGGRIYIMKGLLDFSEGPEEVAAVLAHEIGHVEQRHVVSKLIREFSIGVILSILTGGDTIMITELLQSLINTTFSRSQERDADEFALNLLEDAGVSPQAMTKFFRKLNRKNLSYNESLEFLASHPHNNSRIKRALEYRTGDEFQEIRFAIDWDRLKSAL